MENTVVVSSIRVIELPLGKPMYYREVLCNINYVVGAYIFILILTGALKGI